MFAFYVDKTERTFYTNRKETYVLIFGRLQILFEKRGYSGFIRKTAEY